jgi:NhaP-type Na+/H+ or K+/H+ antiporter
MEVKDVILTLGLMLGVGLLCQLLADALHAPRMLVLLIGGVVLGPSVLDAIDVPLDSMGADILFTFGVSFILFHGGLQLSMRVLSRVAVGLGLLAIPGVVITAFVAGSIAALAFDVPLSTGLLIGAVLAPSDPAILIPLFDRIGIRQKIEQTAIAESALNDATGAVLALVFAGVVLTGDASVTGPPIDFLKELGISTALGIGFGILLSLIVSDRRAGVWRESAAVAVVAVIAVGYFSIDSAGGSGYLGAFLAGLVVGNMDQLRLGMHTIHERDMRLFVDTATDLVVILSSSARGEPAVERHLGQLRPRAGGRRGFHPAGATPHRPPLSSARPPRPLDPRGDRLPRMDARDRGRRSGPRGSHGRSRGAELGVDRDDRGARDRRDTGHSDDDETLARTAPGFGRALEDVHEG